MKKYKHLKKWSSPTTLFLGGEVDLEVIRVVMNVEEAAALIKLTDAAGGGNDNPMRNLLWNHLFISSV